MLTFKKHIILNFPFVLYLLSSHLLYLQCMCGRLSVGRCVHVNTAPCKQEVSDPRQQDLVDVGHRTSVLGTELGSSSRTCS